MPEDPILARLDEILRQSFFDGNDGGDWNSLQYEQALRQLLADVAIEYFDMADDFDDYRVEIRARFGVAAERP